MQIRIKGEHSIIAVRQAIFEQLAQIEGEFGVRYTLEATLYLHPTNGFGDEYTACHPNGHPVKKIYCNGPYACAADEYERR